MSSIFGFLGANAAPTELPEIYPIPISLSNFVDIDVQNIYTRILTDVVERTDGVTSDQQNIIWDNCVANESQDGLITLLAKAMLNKSDLFLVYEKALKVIRRATPQERSQIEADYKKSGESKLGVYITFRNFQKTDMIKFYSALEHCSVGGLYKSMNLSKAIQLKISDLRGSVSLSDSSKASAQALTISKGLGLGKDVLLDAKDILETAKPDLTATNSSMEFIAGKQSFYLGLPISWITGETTSGLSDSGKADSKAVDRGLKPYYFSIIKPVFDALFGVKTSYKSDDFDMINTANETLKTFELTENIFISEDNKRKIINKLFGLPVNEKGDAPKKIEAPIPPPVVAPKPAV